MDWFDTLLIALGLVVAVVIVLVHPFIGVVFIVLVAAGIYLRRWWLRQ